MSLLNLVATLVSICQGMVYFMIVFKDFGFWERIQKRFSKKKGGPRF